MTALGKLLRTTAFQLTLGYLLIFVLFAASLVGYFALNTRRLITEQITNTVTSEINGLTQQYSEGGLRRLVIVVDLRSRRPGSSLYLLTTPAGEGLAGNVGSLEPGVLDHPGWLETSYRRLEATEGTEHRALVEVVQLPGGFRLLVGRDLEERERLYGIITNAGRWSFARGRCARARRRILRQPTRAQPYRCHDWNGANHHGRRSRRPAAGCRHRR